MSIVGRNANQRSLAPGNRNRGAAFLEAAISLPIFVMLVLIIFDTFCYFFMFIFFQYGAHRAVDHATKVEIEVNTTLANCDGDNNPPGDMSTNCSTYAERVRDILSIAEDSARLGLLGGTDFVRFRHYDPLIYVGGSNQTGIPNGSNPQPIDGPAGFLRPGEVIWRLDGSPAMTPENAVQHPTRPFGTGEEQGWPQIGQSWDGILLANPVEVRIEAIYNPITPLIPDLRVIGRQLGYRRTGSFGSGSPGHVPPFPPPPPPTEVPWLSPTPIPSPTNTDEPTPGPSPTYTHTATPLPTLTSTSTITPGPSPTSTHTYTPTITPTPTDTPTQTPDPCAAPACQGDISLQCAVGILCTQCQGCPGCPCAGWTPAPN